MWGYRGTVRFIPRRKAADVYTVTEAHRPLSEDIRYRQRRYLLSMGIRTVCILVAVFLAGHVPLWVLMIPLAGAIVLPYVSVVFANGGREPEKTHALGAGTWEETARKQISGHGPQIRS
ncbi:MAG: hypothetical protein QOE54_4795 [Streptosporangiaceae bacterium]|jgi:hypothetical protein|nr:hypothetical protein [Streptosporangiaceae bacterium]MDX6432429.1 hypothetical protein [Streptosporangiaceae bacterium]